MHLEKWNRKASRSKIIKILVTIFDSIIDLRYKDVQLVMGVHPAVSTSPVRYGIVHHEGLRHHLHDDPVVRSRHSDGAT
jgi:accessory gene regulator protein AgrB